MEQILDQVLQGDDVVEGASDGCSCLVVGEPGSMHVELGPDPGQRAAELVRASEAALNHLGEGTVTGSEVGDEESYYEIEVTLENGHHVDVQLDKKFNVVTTEDDHGD